MKNKSTALYIIACMEIFSSFFIGTDQALAIIALGVATYVYARVSRLEELFNVGDALGTALKLEATNTERKIK